MPEQKRQNRRPRSAAEAMALLRPAVPVPVPGDTVQQASLQQASLQQALAQQALAQQA